MTTFYKFPDEQTFRALETKVPVDVIGLIQDGEEPVLDEAGEPMLDELGNQVTKPIYIEGFHVNTLSPIEGWEDYQVQVNSPLRIFA